MHLQHTNQVKPSRGLLTPEQAAEALNVNRHTIYRMIARGELKAHRYGPRLIRIHVDDLTAFAVPVTAGEVSN